RPILHINGSYHSQDKEGIAWYLRQAQPDLVIMNIHSVEQAEIDKLLEENQTDADFTIGIPSDMTKTY
ncbi:MAG: iron-regulated protein, partial [Bacteroidota bacterium]